jgi:hypothetical protein
MNSLQFLIKQIEIIEYKYQKINENSIENFNIFSILRRENDEVNLHSRFIYELLNPKGLHNQRDIFLKIFLDEMNIEYNVNIFEVYKEQYNIDILLKSKNQVIIIENKIDTQDHSNQLNRYVDIIKKQGYNEDEIKVIYLTLYGEEPNEFIEDIILLSYSQDIKNWITKCIEKVAQKPTLRETLIQYLNLINKLTYKADNQGFIMEVKELLLQKENLKTILNIEDAVIGAKIEIQLKFWKELLDYLQDAQYRFDFYSIYGDRDIKASVYKYYTKKKNRKDYGFEYQIDNNLYFFIEIRDNIYYGFYFKDNTNIDRQIEILDKLVIEWEEPYWRYPTKKLNFEQFNNENILDLLDNNKRKIDIKSISDEVIYLITNYKKELNRC